MGVVVEGSGKVIRKKRCLRKKGVENDGKIERCVVGRNWMRKRRNGTIEREVKEVPSNEMERKLKEEGDLVASFVVKCLLPVELQSWEFHRLNEVDLVLDFGSVGLKSEKLGVENVDDSKTLLLFQPFLHLRLLDHHRISLSSFHCLHSLELEKKKRKVERRKEIDGNDY